jgi:hypothetical protein
MPEPAQFVSGEALRRFELMRTALSLCTFLPGTAHKRFVRQVSQMPLEKITEGQRRHLIRLAYRYRRQMPREHVPSKDAIEALDAAWNAIQAAKPPVISKRRTKALAAVQANPLFDFVEAMHA